MSDCERLRETANETNLAEDPDFQRHVASCPQCQEQLLVDSELHQLFRGIARPGPSPHFNRILRQRLEAERERQCRRRRRLVMMYVYWVAASVASVLVLVLVRWPSELLSTPAVCSFGVVFGMALLTPLILFMSLRVGPLNLIVSTINAFRR
jgi:predicted anti-sigma-YlaC factor YlaD